MAEHVLLIEDDERLSAMVSEYLGARGIKVTARPTATEGLKLVRRGGFEGVCQKAREVMERQVR
jgi:two-component system, OmpR family, phosphate regulon response regulator OmpR